MIKNGIKIYKDEKCEFLIVIGGGSFIDLVKVILMMIVCNGKILDYMGK